jgi:hypothetical protein
MMTMTRTLLLSLLVGVLAACAAPGDFVPEKSTITEVRARAGTPTDIRFSRNGDELWEYATGPSGTETYLLQFGRNGQLKAVTQLLTEERFAKVVPGQTTKAAARDLLGRPSDQVFIDNAASWRWHVRAGGRTGYFVVRFGPEGVALDKRTVLEGG